MIEDIVRNAVLQSLQNDRKLEDGLQIDAPEENLSVQPGTAGDSGAKHPIIDKPASTTKAAKNISNAEVSAPEKKPKLRRGPTPDANWIVLQAKLGVASKKPLGECESLQRKSGRLQALKADSSGKVGEDLKGDKDSSGAGKFSAFMPRAARLEANASNVVALDCEMVGVGPDGKTDALARVSVVNYSGDVLYDTFVKPGEAVTDYRTRWSGVRAEDVSEDSSAVDLYKAQEVVGELLKGRIVVGHAIKHDFKVLKIAHPWHQVRDTAEFYKRLWKRRGRNHPALRTLVAQVLGVDTFQKGEHDSCEDARAALTLYKKNAKEWEKFVREGRTGNSRSGPKKD